MTDHFPPFPLQLTPAAARKSTEGLNGSLAFPGLAKSALCKLALGKATLFLGGALLLCQSPARAAAPDAAGALKLQPVQSEVDYDQVSAADARQCKVSDIDHEGWSGWQVSAPDGSLLRRFADTNGDKKIDLWSYYQYGVEVYRDIDGDFDGKADQYRWLGTSGMRWGIDEDEDGTVDRWKQISAEEVSRELVAALRESDPARFAALLISPKEVHSIGLGKAKTKQIAAKASRAAADFGSLAKRQRAVTRDARWVQFAASSPGTIPEGTDGSTQDVTVYENAVAMYESSGKRQSESGNRQSENSGQLMVGTLIQVGKAWRLVELPSLGAEDGAIAQGSGNFFTPGASRATGEGDSGMGRETQRLVGALEEIDAAFASAKKESEIAKLHERRSDVIEALIAQAGSPTDRENLGPPIGGHTQCCRAERSLSRRCQATSHGLAKTGRRR